VARKTGEISNLLATNEELSRSRVSVLCFMCICFIHMQYSSYIGELGNESC